METTIDQIQCIRQDRRIAATESGRVAVDIDLVAAARRGDRVAFGRLYDQFAAMIHGILLARVSRSEAEDLVQDVFLSALKQLHTLRKDAAFPGWLAMIARNRARDYYRHARDTEELPEDLVARNGCEEEAGEILAVIRSLPEAYRETLILRLVEGMTGDEIAARTGLKPASVRVNLHRGMKQLQEKLRGRRRP